jgi:hypothetical protein
MDLESLKNLDIVKEPCVSDLTIIAKDILEVNPYCKLSGSVALHVQELKTRRTPKDIDIYLPYGKIFTKPDGMVPYANNSNNNEYDDDYYERSSYKYKGIAVDVFTPTDETVPELIIVQKAGFNCIAFFEILKLKVMHSYGDHFTRYKHKDDIVFMMSLIA